MSEQRAIRPEDIRADLPAKVVGLLARPRLTDLPESPVGTIVEDLRRFYADFAEVALPEIVDFSEAQKSIGNEVNGVRPAVTLDSDTASSASIARNINRPRLWQAR